MVIRIQKITPPTIHAFLANNSGSLGICPNLTKPYWLATSTIDYILKETTKKYKLIQCLQIHLSFDESARYDYSSTINYILKETGEQEIFFVGYSMATTQYLILLSELPEFNSKIRAGFLLGKLTNLNIP